MVEKGELRSKDEKVRWRAGERPQMGMGWAGMMIMAVLVMEHQIQQKPRIYLGMDSLRQHVFA